MREHSITFAPHPFMAHECVDNKYDNSTKPWCSLDNDQTRCHHTMDMVDRIAVCGAATDMHNGVNPIVILHPLTFDKVAHDNLVYKSRGVMHEFMRDEGDARQCAHCGMPKSYNYHETQTTIVNIAEEAMSIVYGDREKAYDDPNQNFRRLAFMLQGLLDNKLRPGATITPNDVALFMVCLKISRESFKPHRDNRVDGIGYWLCLDRIVQEQDKDVV